MTPEKEIQKLKRMVADLTHRHQLDLSEIVRLRRELGRMEEELQLLQKKKGENNMKILTEKEFERRIKAAEEAAYDRARRDFCADQDRREFQDAVWRDMRELRQMVMQSKEPEGKVELCQTPVR